MRAASCSRRAGPRWMRSTAFRRRWPSSSACRAAAARARWPPPPRSGTSCACCGSSSGLQHCVHDGAPVRPQSAESIAAQLLRDHRGQHVGLLAPLVVNRKGVYTDLAKWAKARGHTHLRVDGEFLQARPVAAARPLQGAHARAAGGRPGRSRRRTKPSCAPLLAKALELGKGVMHLLHPLDGLAAAMDAGQRTAAHRRGEGVLHQARLPGVRHQLPRAGPAHVLATTASTAGAPPASAPGWR